MITRLFGFAGMVTCLGLVYLFETSSELEGFWRLFHWPAITLTGLGPITLVFICFDFTVVIKAFWTLLVRSPSRMRKKNFQEALYLHEMSKLFYEEGQKAFDGFSPKKVSAFSARMLERLSLRMPLPDIRELAAIEQARVESDLVQNINVMGAMVRLTPSIGMLGTIMGMVRLLSTLDDPSHLGSHMSLALLTTFYGLFFSIVVWTPIQQKAEKILDVEMQGYDQAMHWLELLEKRKPATYFADTTEIAKSGKKRRKKIQPAA